jgi:hypothetical protein
LIISLRIIDLVRRVPPLDDKVKLVLPFRKKTQEGADLAWEAAIIALSQSGHVWEAQALLAIHIGHNNVRALAKPLDILDAVPKKLDTMYSLAYLTMLALLAKSMSWGKAMIDSQLQRWEAHHDGPDLLSCAMDKISDPVTTSRAYWKLAVSHPSTILEITKRGEGNVKDAVTSISDVNISDALERLQDVRNKANSHKDYALILETYGGSSDVLPKEYLHMIGASTETMELLHPEIRLSENFSQSEQIIESIISMLFTKSCLALSNEVSACKILKDQRLHDKAVQDLLRHLGSTRDYERRVASEILKSQAKLSERSVDSLLARLQDMDWVA